MGVLSGKYTRANREQLSQRSTYVGEISSTDYNIIDALEKVASELDTNVAAVALAWVQGKPSVSSTIIGARTMEHLEANLKALDLHLSPEQVAKLDDVSTPTLNFPADFNTNRSPNFQHAGATVNGIPSKAGANVPPDEASRW